MIYSTPPLSRTTERLRDNNARLVMLEMRTLTRTLSFHIARYLRFAFDGRRTGGSISCPPLDAQAKCPTYWCRLIHWLAHEHRCGETNKSNTCCHCGVAWTICCNCTTGMFDNGEQLPGNQHSSCLFVNTAVSSKTYFCQLTTPECHTSQSNWH